ncbi:MAG: type II toxin-antitoxin system VapC family toxin [Bryobacteraceae bacterium]
MTVLLDTSVFLWCITGQQSKLSRKAFEALEDPLNNRWLSAVSLWEIAIKVGTGRLDLPKNADFLKAHMALLRVGRVLPVEASHVFADFGLPRYHRDPFDRMLVAQAQVEGIPFVTCDKQIQKYPVQILW